MILIGDAGGTSTDWRLISEGKIAQYQTPGFNVSNNPIETFVDQVRQEFTASVEELYLYVAGLVTEEQREMLKVSLEKFYPQATIEIENDILGVCRALCNSEPGWVGILGTGSNLVYYDGVVISKRIPSLGWILGDEGSGMHLGKSLIRAYLRNKVPDELNTLFGKTYGIPESEVIKNINTKGAMFLGSFTKFLVRHKDHPYVYNLVAKCFHTFFDAHLESEKPIEPINFSGGIAFYFSDILRKVGKERGLYIKLVVESPISGLVLYHSKQ